MVNDLNKAQIPAKIDLNKLHYLCVANALKGKEFDPIHVTFKQFILQISIIII